MSKLSDFGNRGLSMIYIFIDAEHLHLFSSDVAKKRELQFGRIQDFLRKHNYTDKQVIDAIYNGIINKHDETPHSILERMYKASVRRKNEIAGEDSDSDASERVNNLKIKQRQKDGTFIEGKTWHVITSIVEWLLKIWDRFFNNEKDDRFKPTSNDITGANRPLQGGISTAEPTKTNAGMGIFPLLLLGGAAYMIVNNKK